MKISTAIVIDKRKALKNGCYPVKLRVTSARKQYYCVTKYALTEEEFETVCSKKAKGDLKTTQLSLASLEQAASKIIQGMDHFDFPLFKRLLLRTGNKAKVYDYYQRYIDDLTRDGQLGTASNYTCSMNSLKKFRAALYFSDITPEFLRSYEKWLMAEGKSVTTVGIYLRPLRAIINLAIAEKELDANYNYPFGTKGRGKYQIPTTRNIKKALSKEEIKQLYFYEAAEYSWEDKALDFWIFSYLANGMNMTDVAKLRYNNIDGEFIKFVRSKTKRSSYTITPIVVYINTDIARIIEKWGNPSRKPGNLIFSIIKETDMPSKQRADIQQFTKMVNKYMKIIAQKLGINKSCTTYYARHSFSTMLKWGGADIQFISEALGHTLVSTTRAYLDGFENEKKKEMAKELTNFL